MPIEVSNERTSCCRCGTAYGRKKGYFPVSYGALYKGAGYLPYCKSCVDTMYNDYLAQSGDVNTAVRQMCRKLDLYWNETVCESVAKKATTRTMMTNYIQRINNIAYAGKCYDDTLAEEGRLWKFNEGAVVDAVGLSPDGLQVSGIRSGDSDDTDGDGVEFDDIPEEVIQYWGPGYTPERYQDLETRRTYWINNLPDGITPDVGMEALIRQICVLEIDINRLSASGKSAEKQIGMLDKLISSMNLKPGQKGDDSGFDKTPFGVWIDRLEHERPVADPDPELSDVDGIAQKISTWFYGHASKMLGIKNLFCKLYEDKMEEFRIERGESEDEEDDGYESLFNRIFGGGADG